MRRPSLASIRGRRKQGNVLFPSFVEDSETVAARAGGDPPLLDDLFGRTLELWSGANELCSAPPPVMAYQDMVMSCHVA